MVSFLERIVHWVTRSSIIDWASCLVLPDTSMKTIVDPFDPVNDSVLVDASTSVGSRVQR